MMAEFQEVVKQWQRMCAGHVCDNREEDGLICPITIKHSGYPCVDTVTDLSQEAVAQVEDIVMTWAAEHPEPVYPTWGEWLVSIGVLPDEGVSLDLLFELCKTGLIDRIPADIAEKLGIKPKEG